MIKSPLTLFALGLCVVVLTGCGQKVNQITIRNHSSATVYIKEIDNLAMERSLTSVAPQDEWVGTLSPQQFPKQITVHWYVTGKTNHLPAIKQSIVQFDQDARSRPHCILEFTASRTWTPVIEE